MKIETIIAFCLVTLNLGGIGTTLAMGPDPGGHTGATVTPETTKTGNTTVDRAREARSGSNTENASAPVDETRPVDKERKTAPVDGSRPAQ